MARKEEVLNYPALERELAQNGPERLYLLWGPESYLREMFLKRVRQACFADEQTDDFGYHRFEGASVDMQELSDAVNSLPFLSERTMTELRGFDLNKCRDADAQALESILSDIPDTATVVFVQSADYEPDFRLKTAKAFKKYGKAVKFTAQEQGQLINWIKRRFKAGGKSIDTQAAMHLVFTSGEIMAGLIPEIDKIISFVSGDTVTKENVERCAHHIPESQVFEMTDRLAARDYAGASELLSELLASGEEPTMILAVIAQQMRRLYAARVALDERLGAGYVMEVCGLRYDFIADKLCRTARGYNASDLAAAIDLCAKTDYAMKSSDRADSELLKELLIMLAAEGTV